MAVVDDSRHWFWAHSISRGVNNVGTLQSWEMLIDDKNHQTKICWVHSAAYQVNGAVGTGKQGGLSQTLRSNDCVPSGCTATVLLKKGNGHTISQRQQFSAGIALHHVSGAGGRLFNRPRTRQPRQLVESCRRQLACLTLSLLAAGGLKIPPETEQLLADLIGRLEGSKNCRNLGAHRKPGVHTASSA